MKAGLIVNPASGKAGGRGLALAAQMQSQNNIPVSVLQDFRALRSILENFAAEGVSDLYISSGDGTVQAILTILAESSPFAVRPRIGLIPHGTTNMTAADLGVRKKSVAAQAAFLVDNKPRATHHRHTLRVLNPRDGHKRHGFFVGTGAVWRGVVFCQDAVHKAGLKGELATFATLVAAIAKSVTSRPVLNDPTRIDRPYPMRVRSDGRLYAEGGQLMLLATTLKKLILGTRPFWGGSANDMRVTIFPYPVPSIARWLLPMMYGGEARRIPQGAVSFSGSSFEVETETSFVIDGEFFDPPEGEPLRVELGQRFEYIYG